MYRSSLYFNKMGSMTTCRSCGARITIKDPAGSKFFGLLLMVLLAVPITGVVAYTVIFVVPEMFPRQVHQLREYGINLRLVTLGVIPLSLLVMYPVYLVVYTLLFQFTSLKTVNSK